jgi:D-xylose reductase
VLLSVFSVSNFSTQLLQDLLRYAKVKPACNQLELHPLLPSPNLVRYCQYNNIAVVAFSPFGAQSYLKSSEAARTKPSLLSHPGITAIAARHNKTAAQILLRWSVQRGVAAIPKTVNETRLKENLAVFDFTLTEADVRHIDALNGGVNVRFNDPGRSSGLQCAIWE